ncbi:MAG TPA: hypothetical protein PLG59_10475 [bacterium]|nr:hypothetical protein [bacterium]HQO35079.1 hypothetical protein [bacterium]HQP96968.1 hypothetical protein [bacterium]
MRLSVTLLLAILVALPIYAAPKGDEPVPTMKTSLETAKGAEIGVTYEAMRWDPEIFELLQSSTVSEDAKPIKEYYAKHVAPRLARLSTNVTLKGEKYTLAPGRYVVGFEFDEEKWLWVVANQEGRQAEIPVLCARQPLETAHIAFLIVPGISPDALQLVILYGPYTISQAFLIGGDPVVIGKDQEETPSYKNFFGGIRGEEISPSSATAQVDWRLRTLKATPTPRPSSSLGK